MATDMPKTGEKAPDFLLVNSKDKKVQLKDFKWKWLILYFYPKDNTPGCTTEALNFTALKDKFKKAGAVVVGVSPDSCAKHRNFIEKKGLTVDLLSDPGHQALERYGVWQLKKNYGREYFGVVRTTFLIDPEGMVVKVWPKVRVKEHAEAVLNALLEAKK